MPFVYNTNTYITLNAVGEDGDRQWLFGWRGEDHSRKRFALLPRIGAALPLNRRKAGSGAIGFMDSRPEGKKTQSDSQPILPISFSPV